MSATGNFDRAQLTESLRQGVVQLRLPLEPTTIDALIDYLALLSKWNAVYNLTAVRDPQQMVSQHLLDSLAAVPGLLRAGRVLDVGAGGGLPGMVLALCARQLAPELSVDMIDTVHKKTAFLTQAKVELGLSNVTVHTARVEQLRVKQLFDVITSRAFSELADFVTWSGHLLAPGGKFLAMKGVLPSAEIERLPAPWVVTRIEQLHVPSLDAERHLVTIERQS